jgi:antitoxin component YwqK of YwqJK toxin-antitoxin module
LSALIAVQQSSAKERPLKNEATLQNHTTRKRKMKIILTITMFALTVNAYSQKLVKEYYDWAKTKIKREYYTDAYGTLNGSYKAYSEYGGIMKQGQCQNDGPIGKWIENYDNGKLHYVKIYDTPGTYDFQVKDGKITAYYEDGKTIKYERNFKNMDLDGVWKEYDQKGIITKEGIYVNGVFEPTGITKIKYDEEQEKEKQRQAEILLKNAEEYKKIIPEADKAFLAKDIKKALELYKSASDLMVNEKYPKDKISEILETSHTDSKFFSEYIKSQYDSLIKDFKTQKADFKIKSVKEYNKYTYAYDDKRPTPVSYNCDCLEPWNEQYADNALKCLEMNKEFYEPYQRAITTAFFKYDEALTKEENKVERSVGSFYFENTHNQFYTYDKNTFLANLKEAKSNYELSKSVRAIYNSAIEKKNQITSLNDQNKKKTLFKKYLIVYEDLIAKCNSYTSLTETIKVLNTLLALSDKAIICYSKDTKDLESKLKEVETSEQIQTILLGQ